MGIRNRFRGGRFDGGRLLHRNPHAADYDHLVGWARAHRGVEAYVEPLTTLNELTVVLVDADGRWTRRAPGGSRAARRLGEQLAIPVYDVRKVRYPQRMRDHDARERILRRRAAARELS